MTYIHEFRQHWRVLTGATLGAGVGAGLNVYTAGLFGPALIEAFGWAPSQYALVSTLSLIIVLILPLAGRMADRFGVRPVAGFGFIGLVATYLVMSTMNGSFYVFCAITLSQTCFGALTASSIFSRVVAERFHRARGFGFAVVASGPPLVGALATPVLGMVVDQYDWRSGYLALALLCAVAGIIATCLIPKAVAKAATAETTDTLMHRSARTVLRDVVRHPAFWFIVGGMVLINLPQGLAGAQMKLMAIDSGASSQLANWMMSFYAAGVLFGRLLFGLSLDRYPAHIVTAIGLSLPALGFFGLASSFDAPWVLASCALVVGLAQGAEGDVAAYLISRHFRVGDFSFILGLIGSLIAVSSATGAVLLSITLHNWGSYAPFVIFGACTTLVGALLFLFTGDSDKTPLDERRDENPQDQASQGQNSRNQDPQKRGAASTA